MEQQYPASIPVRSEQQAMDWSLVLASQGIEPVVRHDAEAGRWSLEVAPQEMAPALAALRAYLLENRHRRWQSRVAATGDLYDWRCLVWGLFMGAMYWLTQTLPVDLRAAGCVDGAAIAAGDWWRLLTATTLHADLIHLMANLVTGILLLGLAMGAYGPGAALLASFLGGVLGNVAAVSILGAGHLSLGASGAVLAALGLLCAHAVAEDRETLRRHWLSRGVMGGILLTVLLGLNPGSDILAHVGGVAGGFLVGGALRWTALWQRPGRRLADPWLFYATGLWLALAWALALYHQAQGGG